jgi:hypothetical protein
MDVHSVCRIITSVYRFTGNENGVDRVNGFAGDGQDAYAADDEIKPISEKDKAILDTINFLVFREKKRSRD